MAAVRSSARCAGSILGIYANLWVDVLGRRRTDVERRADLRAQLRTVLVTMDRARMLHGDFEQFLFTVGRDGDRTLHVAGEFAAVDVLAHDRPPPRRARSGCPGSCGAYT